MFARMLNVSGKRRLVPLGLVLVVLAAVIAVLAVAASPLGHGVARAAGSGGSCVSNAGPVCTFKNNAAFADFGSVSSDGCIFTEASLEPFQSLTRPGNTTSEAVLVFLGKFDVCQGILLESASNIDPSTGAPDFTGTLQLDSKLAAATVNGTASMFDSNSGALAFSATINVTWQGFGSTTRSVDSFHVHGPGFIAHRHFNGVSRAAEASGTLTDETGTNLAT